MNTNSNLPTARRDAVVTQNVGTETLVFDKTTRQAHCLNQLAGLVWRHCDGQRSREDLAKIVGQELSVPADAQLIELALQELAQAKLLEGFDAVNAEQRQYTRREVARRLGIGAAAALLLAPLVTSMTAQATPVGSPLPTTTGK